MSNERTYSGISLTERTAARRQRFIEAGIELFGTIGYNATTVRKLTAITELSNRYFYESFESMEDLLIACYDALMDDFRENLQQTLIDSNETLDSKIHNGLTCFYTAMSDPKFARITHTEVLGISSRVDGMYHNKMTEFAQFMMNYLQDSKAAPFSPFQKSLVGAMLVGGVTHAGMVWVRSGYEQPIESVVEAVKKVFLGTSHQFIGSD